MTAQGNSKWFLCTLLYTFLMGLNSATLADDTEIYTDSPSSTGIANILFNLDTSGSMSSTVDEDNSGTIDSGERSRMEVMKEAMISLLDTMPSLNVGLMRYHYHGGPILFPITNLSLFACDIEGNCPVAGGGGGTGVETDTTLMSDNDDDAEEADATTVVQSNITLTMGENPAGSACTSTTYTFNLTRENDFIEDQGWNPATSSGGSNVDENSSDVEIPKDGSDNQLNGVWFRNVNIPDETATTTISSARIVFTIDEQKSTSDDAVDIDIYTVNPDDIDVSNKQLDDTNFRPAELYLDSNHRLATKVDWDIAASDDPDQGEPLFSADITALIRDVLDESEWPTSTKNMAFLFEQDPATLSKTGVRTTERATSAEWPYLEVTYQTCASVSAANVRTGLRFQGVEIPQGVTVNSASITFTAADNDTGAPIYSIKLEDTDEPAAIGATPFSTARTYLASTIPWTTALGVDPLTDWTTDTQYNTPDLSLMVQDIVNKAGWCGGDDLFFMIERTGGDTVKRTAHSRDGDSLKAPTLSVTFDNDTRHASAATGNPDYCSTSTVTTPISASSDDAEEDTAGAMDLGSSDLELIQESTEQDVGLRFKSIPIAQGSAIVDAKITFTVDEVSTGAMTLTFHGEDTDDASTFSSGGDGTNNISDTGTRPRTTASVTWSPPDFNTINNKHEVTGLKDIVQEIIDRGGWTAGNDLAILISGSGSTKRVAKSYDIDNGANAPVLQITFQGDPVVTKDTVRERLKDIVEGLQQRSGTPIMASMLEAAKYYRGEGPLYGRQRGQQSTSKDDVTRISHFASYDANGATVTLPAGCPGEDFDDSDCATQVIDSGNPVYKSPIIAECQTNYLINLTDGGGYFTGDGKTNSLGQNIDEEDVAAALAAEDENENAVSLGTCATDTTLSDGVTVYSGSSHNECSVKLAKFMQDNDQIYTATQNLASGTAPIDGLQNIRTYTIGFNLCGTGNVTSKDSAGEQVCCAVANHNTSTGVCSSPISDPSTITVLKAMADVGDGEYFNANTVEELLAAFTSITSNIIQRSTSFVAPSIAANAFNRLFSRNEVYFGLFEPDENSRWAGNVKKYFICDDTDTDDDGVQDCTLGDVLDATDLEAIVDDPSQSDDGLFKTTATSDWTDSTAAPDGREIAQGGAGGEITDFTDRTIYVDINDNGLSASTNPLSSGYAITDLTWNHDDFDDIRGDVCPSPSNVAGTDCEDRMLWMLGKDTRNEDNDTNTDTRWWHHDVLHSSPEIVTYGLDDKGDADPDNDEFIDRIIVATNEGGIHFIDGSSGEEEWVFMPSIAMANQQNLYDNSGTDHIYGIDSTPVLNVEDVNGNGRIEPSEGDFVHVYVSQRRGGKNIYALDVTPTSELTSVTDTVTPKLLWTVEGGTGDFVRMGQSWSEPRLAVMQTGTTGSGSNEVPVISDVLIFGGGYDIDLDDLGGDSVFNFGVDAGDPNEGNAIYIVDAATGDLIFWVSSDTTASIDGGSRTGADIVVPDMKFSIPSNVTVLDTNGDGLDDRVYVGDMAGQVWRVDLADDIEIGGSAPEGASVVGKLANISSAGTTTEERRFYVPPAVVQVLDTAFSDAIGGEFDYVLIPTGYRAHPLDTGVNDRFYAFRDSTIEEMEDSNNDNIADTYPLKIDTNDGALGAPISNTDLVDVSSTVLSATVAIKASLGWYFDFNTAAGTTLSGEKGLAAPAVFAGTLIFTTYVPDDGTEAVDACSASEGGGNAYNMNILSADADLDWDGDGDIDLDDRQFGLGTGIPSEAVPIFTAEGVTVLVGTGGGAENLGEVSGLPRYRTYWYEEL